MKERILYHACEASLSYGACRISYCVSNISLKKQPKSSMISEAEKLCGNIRRLLIASVRTAKENQK